MITLSEGQWTHWSMSNTAVDVVAGEARLHRFRGIYDVIDDVDVFSRRLNVLGRRRGDEFTMNVDSVRALDFRGNPAVEFDGSPRYEYAARIGISEVGSNENLAHNVLDGDPTTFWEPDPDAPLEDWWIELDLGRVVPVEKIVLRFVDEGQGEPFRQFRVLVTTRGQPFLGRSGLGDFRVVGGTRQPNTETRRFELPMPEEFAAPGWTGRMVHKIRIVVTDSERQRLTRVSERQWEEKAGGDRGEIVYFVRDVAGQEEEVPEEVWRGLPPERQGRRDFYLRERPRLAGVEVWGWGDNVALDVVGRGGTVDLDNRYDSRSPANGFDGDMDTHVWHNAWSQASGVGVLTIDLGASFWLDRMRICGQPNPGEFEVGLPNFLVEGSLGEKNASGQLRWNQVSLIKPGSSHFNTIIFIEDAFSKATPARFLRMLAGVDPPPETKFAIVSEYQLFAQGYAQRADLTSPLVPIPSGGSLGRVLWEGEAPPGSELEVRTRTGSELNESLRHYDATGRVVTKTAWDGLLGSYKGPVDTVRVPGTDWSGWSEPYGRSGESFKSPGRREFLQVKVALITSDPEVTPSIRSLSVELERPVAEGLVAELSRGMARSGGVVDTFEVYLRPWFVARPERAMTGGFDEVRLTGASGLEVLAVEVGVDGEAGEIGRLHTRSGDGVLTGPDGSIVSAVGDEDGGVRLMLPEKVDLLPQETAPRRFHRIMSAGDLVPVIGAGITVTASVYGLLPEAEQGAIQYYQKRPGQADVRVDRATHEALPAEQRGAIRYLRKIQSAGVELPYTATGDTLTEERYEALPPAEQGVVTAPGPLLRFLVQASVFATGTTIDVAARNTNGGSQPDAPWQHAEAGDAVLVAPANTLSVAIPLDDPTLGNITIEPRLVTPNGDGLNDETVIGFTVLHLSQARTVRVTLYRFDGWRVWSVERALGSGRHRIVWDGTDESGSLVAPGMYLCQVELRTDTGTHRVVRPVGVAY